MTALYLHEDVKELLAGKTLVVIGDSVERSVYKDLVCLLQENRYLKDAELRKKGEESFLGDELIYGGCKGEMKNSISYRECRYFKTDNDACCRYYFVTISYGEYVEEVLQELSLEPTDIIVMNSCLWDVHRHGKKGVDKYEENLEKLVATLRRLLPDCLFLWLTTPPLDIKSKGGFLMRPGQDLVKINEVRYCNQIARDVFSSANEIDRRFRIVDLGYVFQYFEHHRASDGVHWNEKAHRRISNMILEEVAKAFDMEVPRILHKNDRYEESPALRSPSMYKQWDNLNEDETGRGLPPPFPELYNNNYDFENRYHENGWEFDNGVPYPHPFPPRPPPPRGYPFGPPRLPPPMPFGHPGHMRPSFIEPYHDLDDLGDARKQVEDKLQQRQYSTEQDINGTPEKNYRFGVVQDQLSSSMKRKSSTSEIGIPSKITIIETDGQMKKLVELGDGTTLHSVMSEKEKEEHFKQLEKEKLERIKIEKEAQEKAEREAKEVEELKKEKERIEKEKIEKAEQFSSLKKLDVSCLPLVSTVPEKDCTASDEKEVDTTLNRVSKFASKLLSFIKNPISKENKSLDESLSSKAVVTQDLEVTPKVKKNVVVYDEKPIISTETPTTKNNTTELSVTTKPLLTTIKKVNTLALLSMQSPFAKTKPSYSNSKQESLPSTMVKEEEQEQKLEEELLNDVDADISDVDDSVLDEDYILKSKTDITDISKIIETSMQTNNFDQKNKENCSNAIPEAENALSYSGNLPSSNSPNKYISKPDKNACEHNPLELHTELHTSINKTETVTIKRKLEIASDSNVKNNSSIINDSNLIKKKKKKSKHLNETKEERTARRKLKKEKKEKAKQEKQNLNSTESQQIQVVSDQWNKPYQNNHNNNRQRSATWAPIYRQGYNQQHQTFSGGQKGYNNINNNDNQFILAAQQQQQAYIATQIIKKQQQDHVIQQQQALLQQQLAQQQLAQQQLAQQQLAQQQLAQQQLLQQQKQQQQQLAQQQRQQQQQQQELKKQEIAQQQQATFGTSSSQPQLYIDEYGQTYTLEEETFMIGPSGEIQNISSSGSGSSVIQQQQQQGVQQQYIQSSLLYSQQQKQSRFL